MSTIYNHLTRTYDTKDGTKVAEELCENCRSALDLFYIAHLRQKQREAMKDKGHHNG